MGAKTCAAGVEAGRDDSAVVEDEEVAGVEEAGKVAEVAVFVGSGGAIESHHAAVAALGGWVLRDQFGGEIEVEVGDAHRSMKAASQRVSKSAECGLGT